MHGQTEATARMAYLPPTPCCGESASHRAPRARRDVLDRPPRWPARRWAGVHRAERDARLRRNPGGPVRGRTITELRTGDLARKNAGLYEVTGGRSRFVKIAGMRVDLGQVERLLADLGVAAASTGTNDRLVVAVEGEHDNRPLAVAGSLAAGVAYWIFRNRCTSTFRNRSKQQL